MGFLLPLILAAAYSTTNSATTPVLTGDVGAGTDERVAPGRPCLLVINRAPDGASGVSVANVSIYGAMLPNPDADPNGTSCVFKGGSAGTDTTFDPPLATMPHAGFSNNNWIVIQTVAGVRTVIAQGAGAGKFQESNPGTTQARITLGTALPAGARLEVYLVTPVVILAAALNQWVRTQIVARTVMWMLVANTASPSATTVQLESLGV